MARRTKGTGSIREREPGVWEVRAPVAGRQKSRTVRGTKAEAEKALRRLQGEVDAGAHRQKRRTVSDLLDRWFAMRSPDLSPTTVHSYGSYIKNHIKPAIGSKPLDKLGTDDLDDLYSDLRGKMAPSSIHQCHAVIHQALKQAKRWGWVVVNVSEDTTRPPRRKTEIEAPDPDMVRGAIDALEANPEYAVFVFLKAASGCRRGELCGLRWSRVDWEESTIDVARAVIRLDGGGTLEKDTKGHNERTIDLDPATMEALRRHREAMEKRAADMGTTLRPDAYVFSTVPDGSMPWNPEYATRQWRKVRDRLELTFRQHDIRHMHITELLPFLDPVNIAKRSGHTDPSMIYRVYGHPSRAQGKRAARVIGELLAPGAQKPPALEAGGEDDGGLSGVPAAS